MKRDWDLIRKQLIDVEEENDLFADAPPDPVWGEQTEEEFVREMKAHRSIEGRILGHYELLVANGYIDGLTIHRGNDGSFAVSLHTPRLTMAGHDLLDTMRSSTIWETIKTTGKSKGIELSFDAIKALGLYALNAVIGS
jgi:Hypothetical protein (DUF2513)